MPVTTLTPKGVKALTCLPNQLKVNHHDATCKGLMLEIRGTGGKTWYLRYRDNHGVQRQFRIGGVEDLSLDQARKRADELRGQIALGQDPCVAKAVLRQVPTFETFVNERYLPFVKVNKRSWKTDESLLRNHLLPRFGKRPLDQITKGDIVALHHGRRAEGAAPASANRLVILTRYIFNLALRWDIAGVTRNPTQGVSMLEENNAVERYLTREEAQRLLVQIKASENPMLQYIISLLLMTGARKREALDAQWVDFDVETGVWRIPMSKSGRTRYVPISDGVIRLLATIREVQATWPSALAGCPWVLANPQTGKPFVAFFHAWSTARSKAGLADVRIHDLRHSFASFLINHGRSLYEVQKILGHADMKMTQRYAHLSQDTLREAANVAMNALGETFAPPVPKGLLILSAVAV